MMCDRRSGARADVWETDVELSLPDHLFRPLAETAPVCLAAIDKLAADCEASVTATGSRYASVKTAKFVTLRDRRR